MVLIELAQKKSSLLEVSVNELVLHFNRDAPKIAHLGLLKSYDSNTKKITLHEVIKLYAIIPNGTLTSPKIKKDSASSNTYSMRRTSYVYAQEGIITFFYEREGFKIYADIITDPVQFKTYSLLDNLFFEKSEKFFPQHLKTVNNNSS